jgi:hypothetical protein
LRQNQYVATAGPYRFVRHPFYLANALIDASLVVMSGSLVLAAVVPVWWLAIYVPVIRGEERYLSEKFPDVYAEFRRRVPCLIPWHRPQPYAGAGFRWDNPNIVGGEELPRAVRILGYPLLFFVAQGVRNGGLDWLRMSLGASAVASLVALHIFAWELERHQRRQKFVLPRVLQHPLARAAVAAAFLAGAWYGLGPRAGQREMASASAAVLLLLSVPAFARRPVSVVLAELLALLGVITASRLVWLVPLSAVIYTAWAFDYALAGGRAAEATEDPAAIVYWPWLYPLVAVASAALIGIKVATMYVHG